MFNLSEYSYILSLYDKQQHYTKRVAGLTISVLLIISLIVSMDIVKTNPFLIYMVGMMGVIIYAMKTAVTGKYHDELRLFLQDTEVADVEDDLFVFFIDYQLANYFELEADKSFEALKGHSRRKYNKAEKDLTAMIQEISDYYDYLHVETDNQDMAISLDWYKSSFDKHKKDSV